MELYLLDWYLFDILLLERVLYLGVNEDHQPGLCVCQSVSQSVSEWDRFLTELGLMLRCGSGEWGLSLLYSQRAEAYF